MEVDDLLAPCEETITLRRNSTKLSKLSEDIVLTFLRYKAAQAVVHHELTDYSIDTLYQGLRNVCKKNDFKGVARVRKQNGMLILIRTRDDSKKGGFRR